jgi:hypothetical protein
MTSSAHSSPPLARLAPARPWAKYELDIRVSGALVSHWLARGFEHPEERVTLLSEGRFRIESTTHGDADEIELQLDALARASLSIEVRISAFDGSLWREPVTLYVPAAELLERGTVRLDLGGEGLFVAVERVTSRALPLSAEGELSVPLREGPNGVYPVYPFGRELGDAKVWASPLFVRRS